MAVTSQKSAANAAQIGPGPGTISERQSLPEKGCQQRSRNASSELKKGGEGGVERGRREGERQNQERERKQRERERERERERDAQVKAPSEAKQKKQQKMDEMPMRE